MRTNVLKYIAFWLILIGSFSACEKHEQIEYENSCGFEDPLTDLPWLKGKIEEIVLTTQSDTLLFVSIYQCTYGNNETCFLIDEYNIKSFYNCNGDTLCIIVGLIGELCSELNIDIQNKKLIWETGNNHIIMRTLKGEWSWEKAYGGLGGNTRYNEFKSILNILSQNDDKSINYEIFVADTLFYKGTFQLKEGRWYITANIKLPHWISPSDENWIIYFGDMRMEEANENILCFWDGGIDGYMYYYQKIK